MIMDLLLLLIQRFIESKSKFSWDLCTSTREAFAKAFDCVDHNKLENSWRDGNTRLPNLLPEKSVCRSRNNN